MERTPLHNKIHPPQHLTTPIRLTHTTHNHRLHAISFHDRARSFRSTRPRGRRSPGAPTGVARARETVDRRDRIPACAPHHGQAVAQDDVEEQDEQLDVDEEQVDPNTVSE